MAYTDQSDVYLALSQEAINHAVNNIKFQRPSIFNYGTKKINEKPDLLCVPIVADSNVDRSQYVALKKPLKFHGKYNLDFGYQFENIEFKFHPVDSSINENQFQLTGTIHLGIGIPDKSILDPLIINDLNYIEPVEEITIQSEKLECFQLELRAVGHFDIVELAKNKDEKDKMVPSMLTKIDSIELKDITPIGLKNTFDIFAYDALSHIKTAVYNIHDKLKIIHLIFAPSKTVVPNPLIAENQLKLFIDTEVEVPNS
ncbi:hypothetical protein [Bacillus wiedmannii]|uniref:Uncharacterized protein n=1 Tax=Bacillus wiedmannii TaxID=1890302 RepID=A0A2B5XER2_9BACI|nr:hypothetical protein [Bacillus wiedmannii]PEM50738.1 hypothetical protein CN611_22555 [Bacillus wiedmannii]PGA94786.1 hypothetical protein COL92_24035 [Bacillus wiedmannii]